MEKAKQHLTACGLSAKFICSPMEEECGIPMDYFDFVYSIYVIGWTTIEQMIEQSKARKL
ncbi:hypothetical protein [Paenibacillus terreus]|uniref:hypothetical protein n=1 Tax=Paenibacillus terreus TaxID=1387834 RepID=UPI0035CD020A